MRIKITFDKNTIPLTGTINESVNGFINKCLGKNNRWHDVQSSYSISQMHGGKLVDKLIQYPNGGYITIASDDKNFLNDILSGLMNANEYQIQSMKMKEWNAFSPKHGNSYDIIHIENIKLTNENKRLLSTSNECMSCFDDNFIERLRSHSIKKLIRHGIPEQDANTITFSPIHPERWKMKYCKIKKHNKTIIIPASNVMVMIKGKKYVREKLANLGVGKSTGYGFGFIELKND